jgi:hypothetical protein
MDMKLQKSYIETGNLPTSLFYVLQQTLANYKFQASPTFESCLVNLTTVLLLFFHKAFDLCTWFLMTAASFSDVMLLFQWDCYVLDKDFQTI